MASDEKANLLFQGMVANVMKVKNLYDGSNRLITRYEAFAHAVNGDPCLRTDYTYVGATTNLDAMKESSDVWQSAWDI
jgi:hypothetical protein